MVIPRINIWRREDRIFLAYTTGFLMGWMAWIARADLLFFSLRNIFQGLSFLFFLGAALMVLANYSRDLKRTPSAGWKVLTLILFYCLMILLGMPNFLYNPHEYIGFLLRDLTPIVLLLAGLSFCYFDEAKFKLFGILFLVIAISVILWTIGLMDVAFVAMSKERVAAFRETGNFQIYALQTGIGSTAIAFLVLYVGISKIRIIVFGLFLCIIFYLFSSLYYSKRQGLLQLAMVFFFLFYYFSAGSVNSKHRAILLGTLTLSVIATSYLVLKFEISGLLVDRMSQRITDLIDDRFQHFDRIEEARYFLAETPFWRLVIGSGFSSHHMDITAKTNVHIGFLNLVFKGGIFFALFYVGVLIYNIIFLILHKGFPFRIPALFFPVFALVELTYAPTWGLTPSLFWTSIAFFSPEISFYLNRKLLSPHRRQPFLQPHQKYGSITRT